MGPCPLELLKGAWQGHTCVQYEVPHVCAAVDTWLHKHMPASLECMSISGSLCTFLAWACLYARTLP